MGNWLNTQIIKDKLPAGPITKFKKESGILTDGNPVNVYTDNGLRSISLDSRILLEGNPVANQDTIGVMSNPSNNSSVWFRLGADGNQELETSTGSKGFKPLSKNSPWFQKNLDRIREVIGKARFNTDPEDEARWRSLYEAGGKVENAEKGIKFKRNFARYGDTGDFNEFMFAGKTPFGKVVNEFMHPVLKDSISGEYIWRDFDPKDIGRYIQNQDTVYWEGKYTNDKNPFGVSPDQEASKKKFIDLLKYNTTGALYNDNDKNTLTRLRIENREQGGKLYNEDLIAAIEACGGKMKKKK